jgi:hypothetical protein
MSIQLEPSQLEKHLDAVIQFGVVKFTFQLALNELASIFAFARHTEHDSGGGKGRGIKPHGPQG